MLYWQTPRGAKRYGCTTRTVQLAVHGGQLSASRQIGRTRLVDDLAAQAWHRASVRGRRWTDRACEAALDLLSAGTTQPSPEQSAPDSVRGYAG